MSRPVRILARHQDGHERFVERVPNGDWIVSDPGRPAGSGRFLACRFDNVRMWAKAHGYQLVSANIPKGD